MLRFIVVVRIRSVKCILIDYQWTRVLNSIKLMCSFVYLLSLCRYRFQSTQTHIGSMFEEFCWAVWVSTTKFIMCCYFRGNVGWKYVGATWIYVQGRSACVAGGTQQLLKSGWKSSGWLTQTNVTLWSRRCANTGFSFLSLNESIRLKVCQRNMDVWLQRNHSHMNKIEDTKETVRRQHHRYRWTRWNKSAIHWWIQVARDWVAALHHTFSKCTGRSMQHASEINAAHSANRNGRAYYAMDRVATMPTMRVQLTSDYGELLLLLKITMQLLPRIFGMKKQHFILFALCRPSSSASSTAPTEADTLQNDRASPQSR